MSIPARYSGVCPECGERWQPGDLIRSVDRAVTKWCKCEGYLEATAFDSRALGGEMR